MSPPFGQALVVGAGSFGQSMACVLANNFEEVFVKSRSPVTSPPKAPNITMGPSWKEGPFELILNALPSGALAEFFSQNQKRFEKQLDGGGLFVSLSKGLDPVALELADDLLFQTFPRHKEQLAFLSGPSFAREILQEQITLVSLASKSLRTLEVLQKMFRCSYFKVVPSYDIKGVLLGGALKNVLAIAGGIVEGLGLNHNTRAALITQGIAEMLKFGLIYNARPETFYGLSGMGDLILSTTGGLSRNKSFGLKISQGQSIQSILASQKEVVEGYKTAKAVHHMAQKYSLCVPLFSGVYKILYERANPKEIIVQLMKS